MNIRNARQSEGAVLTELALQSKATWGYSAKFMHACIGALTINESDITDPLHTIRVIEDTEIAGFYFLKTNNTHIAILESLFIKPNYMRKGLGTLLFNDAIEHAKIRGCKVLELESDPHALGFYQSLGALQVGTVPSIVDLKHQLPLLEYHLSA